jgi:thiol:disulfide interchange protein
MQNSKKAGRPWLYGAMFVWALTGAVAYATYSSRPNTEVKLAPLNGQDTPNPFSGMPQSASTSAAAVSGAAPTKIVWEDTFEAAMQRARTEKKPIMVDFYTDWCGWCKELDSKVFPSQPVVEESAHWISIKINAEKRPDVAGAYGVTGYPTIVFAHSSGKPLDILPGYAPPAEFANAMKSARAKWTPDGA